MHLAGFKLWSGNIQKARTILYLMLCSACVSPAELAVEPSGGKLVVSGQISTLADRTFIELGITADTERLPNPLSRASVSLVDEVGNSWRFTEKKAGRYTLDQRAIPGKTYFVSIILSNGREYQSKPETVPLHCATDATSFDFSQKKVTDIDGIVSEKTFIDLYVSSGSPVNVEPFTKWEVEEVYVIVPTTVPGGFGNTNPSCYVTQNADPQNIVLLNRSNFKSDRIEGLLVASRMVDQSFHTRHYFLVFHSAISADAYEYWRRVDVLSNNVGSIFDTPPAELRGNVSNIANREELVLGYFQAVNETMNRFYLLEQDMPYRLRDYCEYLPFRDASDYPSECGDCLRVRNSSHERPEWF